MVPKTRNKPTTNTWVIPLTIRPFFDSFTFLLARVRCIKSWSRPVMAITMKIPARNCFQK